MTDPDDLPALYRDIFESDTRGAAILEDLHARFGSPKVVTVGGIDAVLQTYSSTAKSTVIAYILNRIDQANGRRPINQQDEETSA